MSTPKQQAANRRNAQQSTGPITPEGKAASKLNSLKHGLASQTHILPFESQADFDALEQALIDDLQPQGPAELLLVQRFAQKQWLVDRLARTERGWLHALYQKCLADGLKHAKNPKPHPDPYQGLALCMLDAGPSDPHDLIHKNFFRYRAQIENDYQRALRALERNHLIGPHRRPATWRPATPSIQTENPTLGSAPQSTKTQPAQLPTRPAVPTPIRQPNHPPPTQHQHSPAYDGGDLPCRNPTP